jgi:lipopolysaccharide export system permease protein
MHFDDNGSLLRYMYAEYANIINEELWQLRNVVIKTFNGNAVEIVTRESVPWEPFLKEEDISTLTKSPESLSPAELFLHVHFLRATGQESDAYELALWGKAVAP